MWGFFRFRRSLFRVSQVLVFLSLLRGRDFVISTALIHLLMAGSAEAQGKWWPSYVRLQAWTHASSDMLKVTGENPCKRVWPRLLKPRNDYRHLRVCPISPYPDFYRKLIFIFKKTQTNKKQKPTWRLNWFFRFCWSDVRPTRGWSWRAQRSSSQYVWQHARLWRNGVGRRRRRRYGNTLQTPKNVALTVWVNK